MKIYIIGYIIFIIVGGQIFHLITNKNYYGWPAITKCRICNKTVWEWQSYERRDYTVKRNSYIIVGASGIVHTSCKGHPEFIINVDIK